VSARRHSPRPCTAGPRNQIRLEPPKLFGLVVSGLPGLYEKRQPLGIEVLAHRVESLQHRGIPVTDCHTATYPPVPAKAFFSITVYGPKKYLVSDENNIVSCNRDIKLTMTAPSLWLSGARNAAT
jgi:hypothetical protein